MADKPETSSEGEGSEVRPLPEPRPGQPLQEGDEPRILPKPRRGQPLKKADHRDTETK